MTRQLAKLNNMSKYELDDIMQLQNKIDEEKNSKTNQMLHINSDNQATIKVIETLKFHCQSKK